MHDESSIPVALTASRDFSVPNIVFVPLRDLAPAYLEPRYCQMTADALAGDRLIPWCSSGPARSGVRATAPLYSIACLGKILADQQTEDGRYNILLRGLKRVRILS